MSPGLSFVVIWKSVLLPKVPEMLVYKVPESCSCILLLESLNLTKKLPRGLTDGGLVNPAKLIFSTPLAGSKAFES